MARSLIVTGAAGTLGKLVIERLIALGAADRVVAVTRRPEGLAELASRGVEVRAGDFDQPGSLSAAFAGVSRALVISTDSLDKPGHRVQQHETAFKALVASGAEHISYTSIVNPVDSRILLSKDHAASEAALARTGTAFTSLRDNIYGQMLLDGAKRAFASGKLVDARGAGRVAYVSREDVAAVAAAVLLAPPPGNQLLDVTGPESLSGPDIARLLSEVGGRPVEHQSIPLEALVDGMVAHGLPRPIAEVYASFDAGIAAGEVAAVSDTVERLTGKKPETLGDLLRRSRGEWAVSAP
jgi:NAD(P)H dehydrogenase (quinone)